MKFFSDPQGINCDFALIKIQKVMKFPGIFKKFNEIIVDPGVYELMPKFQKKHSLNGEYSFEKGFNVREFLDSLPQNSYFSLDYPCDMNEKYTDLFLEKSWNNAQTYCNHPNYIATAQYKLKDINSFKKWFNKYNALEIKSGILGLGNLCRIFFLTDYMKKALKYAFSHCRHKRIHIYGLALRNIPYAYNLAKKYNIELSIDSTKWTRAVNELLKVCYGAACRKNTRQYYFEMYKETLLNRDIKLENKIKWLN